MMEDITFDTIKEAILARKLQVIIGFSIVVVIIVIFALLLTKHAPAAPVQGTRQTSAPQPTPIVGRVPDGDFVYAPSQADSQEQKHNLLGFIVGAKKQSSSDAQSGTTTYSSGDSGTVGAPVHSGAQAQGNTVQNGTTTTKTQTKSSTSSTTSGGGQTRSGGQQSGNSSQSSGNTTSVGTITNTNSSQPTPTPVTNVLISFINGQGQVQTYVPPTIAPIDVNWVRYTNTQDHYAIDLPAGWQIVRTQYDGHEGISLYLPDANLNAIDLPSISFVSWPHDYLTSYANNSGQLIVNNVSGNFYTNGPIGISSIATVFQPTQNYFVLGSSTSTEVFMYVFDHMVRSVSFSI